ncbi:PstS family phosphate ABC transporter substrate-binding protein [Lentzea sp. CA-135723]|uniref:PstS family phosphate ABC transporter substrate-binding protein n=1 Tax=Lentzea sp. CA-135723 TaxID=3239950 RepID=UPI003D8AE436
MLPEDPAARSRLRKASRELLKKAYPEYDDEQIEHEVDAAEERADLAGDPGAVTAAPPGTLIDDAAPDEGKAWSRPVRAAVATVVLAAALVLMALFVEQTAGTSVRAQGIWGLLVVAAIAGGLVYSTHQRAQQERLLSCRVRIDAPFSVDRGRHVSLDSDGEPLTDAGIVVARVKNTGRERIESDDYVSPLSLHFPGRRLVSLDVTESEPQNLATLVAGLPDLRAVAGEDRVTLPRVRLKPDASYKVVIVLEGEAAGANVEGRLRDGRITTQETKRRTGPYTPLWAGLTVIFLTGALTAFLLPPVDRPANLACVRDSLTLSGSTAFASTAAKLAGAYETLCPGSVIRLSARGSVAGLQRLNDAEGDDRRTLLALSDVKAGPEFEELRSTDLAIIPFTVIANPQRRIANLTTPQVIGIFMGGITNWKDITGEDHPIHVVARTTDSGTRKTLETRLGVPRVEGTSENCTEPRRPGTQAVICERTSTSDVISAVAADEYAIGYADLASAQQNTGVTPLAIDNVGVTDLTADSAEILRLKYRFWAVERIYRTQAAVPGTLASAYLEYLRTSEAAEVMRQFRFLPCTDPQVESLCAG